MNNKRMRFGFLVLAMYAALGVIGVSSRESAISGSELMVSNVAVEATVSTSHSSSNEGGGPDVSVQWQSFLPGAFK